MSENFLNEQILYTFYCTFFPAKGVLNTGAEDHVAELPMLLHLRRDHRLNLAR